MNVTIKHSNGSQTKLRIESTRMGSHVRQIYSAYYGVDGYYKAGMSWAGIRNINEIERALARAHDEGDNITPDYRTLII